MRFSKTIIIFSLILMSCGSNSKENFTIDFIKKSEFLKKGNKIEFSISNIYKKNITDLKFYINDEIVNSPHIINNNPGSNTLNASFTFDNKKYNIKKEFFVYSSVKPKLYSYKIINEYTHSMSSYTQGLEFDKDGILYEGTGQFGFSALKKYNYKSGEEFNKIFLDKAYFGEGITIINDNIYQLTWKSNIGFVYSIEDFKLLKSFSYNNSIEGWGLCNDGKYLYKSDGTEKIWKLDPNTLEEIDFISVTTNNKIINKINELEWFNNKIYANTYQFNKEVGLIIEPSNGQVEGVIDFTGLKDKVKKHPKLDVLNGIAYNQKTSTFFVTGKNWNKLFEIKIIEKTK